MASGWLQEAGVAHLPITADNLQPLDLAGVSILVVPLERVRTEAQARWVAEFAARGGKLLAVYWGPIVREEARSRYPVYSLASLLGIRPSGWRGADAIVVRPGERPAAEEVADTRLARGLLVRVEPQQGAAVLARWAPPGASGDAGSGPLAVGFGNHLYLALDLFAPQNATAEGRRIFFWALNQLAPQLVFSQARARAGAAMAAVIRAEAALAEAEKAQPGADYQPLREKLAQARDCATRAKQAAAADQYPDATAQSVRALALAEEVMRALKPSAGAP